MDAVVAPGPLAGALPAIASKSVAHRALICAALADGPTQIDCNTTSADIDATAACLRVLGADVRRTERGFFVRPACNLAEAPLLDCGESGSTERFLLPVAAALHHNIRIVGHGRLADRPLSPLYEQLIEHGAELSEQGTFPLHVGGSLAGGSFELPGNVSSQFVSGLLLAAPLLAEGVSVAVAKPVESRSYIDLTIDALALFGVRVQVDDEPDRTVFSVAPGAALSSPGIARVEGDWSNAAFWLAAGALSRAPEPAEALTATCADGTELPTVGVTLSGLDPDSAQGDRAIVGFLRTLGARVDWDGSGLTAQSGRLVGAQIDVADCPDLVPPLAAVAVCTAGETRITGAGRLRLKESDRLVTVSEGLASLGADIRIEGDSLAIRGRESLDGGTVDAAGDHRIAMMAAVASTRCSNPVRIVGAQAVSKSYPGFFDDLARLGGHVEMEG